MAKSRAPSKHSRAARRASAPSFDTDKSPKDVPERTRTSASADVRPSVLDVHRSAGISKKLKPARKSRMSTKMRRRREKGLEMAAAVTERTGMKMQRSIVRAVSVQKRSRAWEDVNREAGEEEVRVRGLGRGGMFGALVDDGAAEDKDKEWETDGETEGETEGDGFDPRNGGVRTVGNVGEDEDGDEIL
ncbi:hypothetical protein C2857_000611 [Epichloe festucae Fl1]|uniref:Ribosome biogenesis protein Alb1 n=1 Tax=Epichloe festucae (strain Fl1) TaxID=877507 RepID=A0A7S9KUC5_EPIFF|nr:hypothetical protein C2857_000611 [Epichloe festucae Fl1]